MQIATGAVRMAKVSLDILVRSFPASNGAASIHHIVKWLRSCSALIPLPT